MRYSFLALIFAGLLWPGRAAQAQAGAEKQVHAALQWGVYTEVSSPGVARHKVPTFARAQHGTGEQVGTFLLRLEGNVGQGSLRNEVYEPFSAADARLLNAGQLPAALSPELRHGTERKLPVSFLALRPVRRNPATGQPERLVSFDYSYSLINTAARGGVSMRQHAPQSVLANGDWYKVGVAESGIYKLDLPTLRKLKLNVQGLNPNRVRLYGNATGLLPQANREYRPDDLVENDIQFVGNGDAVFDENEYFLFYARGPHVWTAVGDTFRHVNHIYSDTAYYFLTVGTAGRRVSPAAVPAGNPSATITTFNERRYYEHDLVNLLHSGRQWLGEAFNGQTSLDFSLGNLPDLVPNSPVRVKASVAAASPAPAVFQVSLNGQVLGTQTVPALGAYDYAPVAESSVRTYRGTLPAAPAADQSITLSYSSSAGTGTGYLDYLELNALRRLNFSGSFLEFRSFQNIAPQAVSQFVLSNASGVTVWDVTDPRRPQARPLDANGAFLAPTDTLREFIAFQQSGGFPTPRPFGAVSNQNLHALARDLDLVIVTYPPFRGEAERLANHRRSHDKLKVAVVTTSEVYNEYSSGSQDVTAIRDLMKQVYDNAPAGKHISLLLFGDASFDYKSKPSNDAQFEPGWWAQRSPFRSTADFDRVNQNYVPTYQSRESFSPFYQRTSSPADGEASYCSEDYYMLLDDNEGTWDEFGSNIEMLDGGVGRLPIRTPVGSPNSTEQAHAVVSKLIGYDTPTTYGKWRNRVTMVSDDGNGGLFVLPTLGSEAIIASITSYPIYNFHKVYLDLYPQVSVAAGQRSPACNKAIDEAFERGSLIINYLGHGGPKGWADEQILTNASVMALRNQDNLPLLVTGTCDFATYDNPDFTSAGEQVLTDNEAGGAIGLFTTTRVVDAGKNGGLNLAFYDNVFRPVAGGQMPQLGQVTMLAKNAFAGGGINNRNYTLLGDPSEKLAYPEQEAVLTTLNGRPLSADTIRALDRVRITGEVRNNGQLNTSFSGTAQVTIFDKPATVMTLGDEGTGGDAPQPIKVQESVIYDGQASVVNGRFSLAFVVPKDINYSLGLGKISLYAFDKARDVDAAGAESVPVGGAAQQVATDTIPPTIRLAMNDDSFVFGGLTGLSPTLLATLSDSSGINTTGAGIGHDITATLDRDPSKVTILNESYTAELDNFRRGRVRYLFKNLSAGPHTLRVKAWDTYNNSSEKEIEFIAASNEQLALSHVLNYPNPFSTITTFHFDHNRSGEDMDVQVQIFTVTGKLVRTLRASVQGSEAGGHQQSISWNGQDEYGDQLARGVYVYRVNVRLASGGSASKYEKLVLLN